MAAAPRRQSTLLCSSDGRRQGQAATRQCRQSQWQVQHSLVLCRTHSDAKPVASRCKRSAWQVQLSTVLYAKAACKIVQHIEWAFQLKTIQQGRCRLMLVGRCLAGQNAKLSMVLGAPLWSTAGAGTESRCSLGLQLNTAQHVKTRGRLTLVCHSVQRGSWADVTPVAPERPKESARHWRALQAGSRSWPTAWGTCTWYLRGCHVVHVSSPCLPLVLETCPHIVRS